MAQTLAPLLLAVGFGLIFWASDKVSYTEIIMTPANRPEEAGLASYFFAGLTAMVALGNAIAQYSRL